MLLANHYATVHQDVRFHPEPDAFESSLSMSDILEWFDQIFEPELTYLLMSSYSFYFLVVAQEILPN